jgi:MFS family permease
MVRLSYRYEMRAAMTFPLAASLAEGSFTSVVAAKNFDASITLMSVIFAAPMFGNIVAMMWSQLSLGRRKVPLVNLLQLGVVVMIASVALDALLPHRVAGWVFAAQIVAARLMASGITTLRSAIWRANYPRQARGHVVSRITAIATAALAATTLLGSYLLDLSPRAYVYLYPAAALLGVVGIWQFSHIRIRHESLLRRREEQLYTPTPENIAESDETNVLNYVPAPRPHWFVRMFTQAWEVLRRDKDFRDYQRWQFLSGVSFMMFQPALLYMVSREMTDPKRQYLLATFIVQIIPMIFSFVFAPVWAPFFDRVHITRFRTVQMAGAVMVHVTIFLGALTAAYFGSVMWGLAIVAVGQVLVGISNAAGNLAWNLGHIDFAPPEQAETYMAVHVMLTGVRGCLAPFFGSAIYRWLEPRGYLLFLLSGGVCLTSLLGFASMARRVGGREGPTARGEPLEEGRQVARGVGA